MGGFFVIILLEDFMETLLKPISEILEFIKTNKNFRAKMLAKDDSLIDSLYKFLETPDCQNCISKLKIFINENISFINNIIKELYPSTQVNVPSQNQNIKPASAVPLKVAGEVYEIDADPQQYKELMELAQSSRWIFRGLNIVERVNNDGKKVWSIFFY
jgi:hypothetical protein